MRIDQTLEDELRELLAVGYRHFTVNKVAAGWVISGTGSRDLFPEIPNSDKLLDAVADMIAWATSANYHKFGLTCRGRQHWSDGRQTVHYIVPTGQTWGSFRFIRMPTVYMQDPSAQQRWAA